MFEVIKKSSGIQLIVYSVMGPIQGYGGFNIARFLFYVNGK